MRALLHPLTVQKGCRGPQYADFLVQPPALRNPSAEQWTWSADAGWTTLYQWHDTALAGPGNADWGAGAFESGAGWVRVCGGTAVPVAAHDLPEMPSLLLLRRCLPPAPDLAPPQALRTARLATRLATFWMPAIERMTPVLLRPDALLEYSTGRHSWFRVVQIIGLIICFLYRQYGFAIQIIGSFRPLAASASSCSLNFVLK